MIDVSGPPLLFDRRAVRHYRRRALAAGLPDFLNEAIGVEIADRLSGILRDFGQSSSIGRIQARSSRRSGKHVRPRASVVSDIVPHPDVDVVIDEEALPFAPQSLDCVIWILGLDQLNDLPGTLIQSSTRITSRWRFSRRRACGRQPHGTATKLHRCRKRDERRCQSARCTLRRYSRLGCPSSARGLHASRRRCRSPDGSLCRASSTHARSQGPRPIQRACSSAAKIFCTQPCSRAPQRIMPSTSRMPTAASARLSKSPI